MARLWLFIIFVLTIDAVDAADDLSDFSNNLATDLGPLLVLFGESMTRQYLSESTSFLDYFIFAMAPIGIITAVVSTIRVCGRSSLRAFIGRSQEGNGIVEAELCTSTSRDVCELFNKGGITRVLGRPHILELVYVPPRGSPPQKPGHHSDKTGLYLFRHHLEKNEPDTSDWTISGSSHQQAALADSASSGTLFAPKPNLSLNVGIKKQQDWVFLLVAIVGFVLQAGVISLAAVGVWILHWNLSDASTSAARDYAPVMFIVGTTVMCGGIWSCAALIGQTTYEVRYERKSDYSGQRTRLFWLQPGPQVIGDQTFDPFAYIENDDNRLHHWISSKKDFNKNFELYTFFAVSAVLAGYIMQFIGLRGMKAWVSLAQLGITVVMSILRGLLRMQRLGKGDNKLEKIPDLVVGHELDWLAFQIARGKSQKGLSWHLVGEHEKATETGARKASATDMSWSHSSQTEEVAQLDGDHKFASICSPQAPTMFEEEKGGEIDVNDLLSIRARLAHLTGHSSFHKIEESECQKWNDSHVKVRTRARKLSSAICQVLQNLEGLLSQSKGDISLRVIGIASLDHSDGSAHRKQPIDVILKRRPESTNAQASWSVDSAQLEAILGLWMWSLVSDERITHDDDSSNTVSDAEEVETMRIISAGIDDKNWHSAANRQGEMSLWLGPNAVTLREATLTIDEYNYSLDLWDDTGSDSDWVPKKSESNQRNSSRRFCGWNLVQAVWPGRSNSIHMPSRKLAHDKIRVQFIPTSQLLLDVCTQELFIVLISSLSSLLKIEKATAVERDGNALLDSPVVTTLVEAFEKNGLGSRSDALMCTIPALGNHLRPDAEDMLSALITAAGTYRREAEWERAEALLRWACQHYHQPHREEKELAPVPKGNTLVERALRATGELYRWSLVQHSDGKRMEFGRSGISWMNQNFHNAGQRNPEVKKILRCYREIAQWIVGHPGRQDSPQDTNAIRQQLGQAIQERDRTKALYLLCFISTGGFGSEDGQPTFPLAVRNDWSEVVSAMLEMKANPDNRDQYGRTAISYCAELGYGLYVKPLKDSGAFLDRPDKDQRTPLFWAAEKGHTDVAELLLDTGYVDTNRPDKKGQMPLWRAIANGHEGIVRRLLERDVDIELKDNDSRTALSQATASGHEAMVQLLLKRGANIESRDNNGQTPLSQAATSGHKAIIQQLLEGGADIESKENNGQTPLSRAAASGHEAIIQQLLERNANIESKDDDNQTPLSQAAAGGHEAIVQRLLDGGAAIESNNIRGETPLSRAAGAGHAAIVERLLEKGVDIDSKSKKYNNIQLSLAARYGQETIVQKLLERGADIDSKDYRGHTPMSQAAIGGNEAIVQRLLDSGADIQSKDNIDRTPLSQAAGGGHVAIVQRLLDNGADIGSEDCNGETPLSWAVQNGHETIVQRLLERGAGTESRDDLDGSPLLRAAARGRATIVKLLLESGASVNSKDILGDSPLSVAASNGHETIVQQLLGYGADIEIKNNDEQTPLSWAAACGNEAIMQRLLERGANIESKDIGGRTPLWRATALGMEAIVQRLLERGADIESKDNNSQTLLSIAIANAEETIVQRLLENGANIESKGNNGWTPLSEASASGYKAIVKRLLEWGADIEAKDNNGRTPLSWAAAGGHEAVIQQLLERGANVESKDNDGRTPLSWAALKKRKTVVELLERKA